VAGTRRKHCELSVFQLFSRCEEGSDLGASQEVGAKSLILSRDQRCDRTPTPAFSEPS